VIKVIGTTTAALLVAGAVVPSTATAATTVNCSVGAGSVTAGGDQAAVGVVSTAPPKATTSLIGRGVFAPGQVKLSSSMAIMDDGYGGYSVYGDVVVGDGLYSTGYSAEDGTLTTKPGLTRIGGGWTNFTALDIAEYQGPTEAGISRRTMYALRSDGVLFRWDVDTKGVWRNKATATGFAAVKSMALISKSKTYDTFIANTRGGALYTIHIPTASPMKPVVKQVRRSTWQGFDALLAQACGRYGTILLGIDRDTDTGYLYAVGHATGTTTVIQSLGKVPATFGDTVYFRWRDPGSPMNGE